MPDVMSPTDPDLIDQTRRLVTYLRFVNRNARPGARDALKDASPIWLNDLMPLRSQADDVFLAVERQPPDPFPVPPPLLDGWLSADMDLTNPWGEGPSLRQIDKTGPGSGYPDEVVRAMHGWDPLWREWAAAAQAAPAAADPYASLQDLIGKALKEDQELVLGVGLVSLFDSGRWLLRQHVLVAEVEAEVDADHDIIRLALVDGLHRADEDALDLNDGYIAARAGPPLGAPGGLDPLSPEVERWLHAWLERHWRARPRWEPVMAEPDPAPDGRLLVTMSPALFLRQRESNGVAGFYDQIARTLEGPEARCPLGLAQLVQPMDSQQRVAWLDGSSVVPAILADPLLPLASNQQQRHVVEQLRTDAAVVVQGPPGTGKTHTIANLISALLADGLRVLVTSKHAQPLRVVHDLLPESVRNLAVLATGKSADGRKDLDRTLIALSEQSSVTNEAVLRQEIDDLRRRHADLRHRLVRAGDALRDVRAEEYQPRSLSIDGYSGTPAQVAAAVERGRAQHGWVGPVPSGAPSPPLSDDEAGELLGLLRRFASPDAATDQEVPDPETLMQPRTVVRAVRAIIDAEHIFGADLDEAKSLMNSLSGPVLQEIARSVDGAADALGGCGLTEMMSSWDMDDWRRNAAIDMLQRRNTAAWQALSHAFSEIAAHLQTVTSARDRDVEWVVEGLSEADYARLLRQAKRLRAYLQGGGGVRRFCPSPEQSQAAELLVSCTVGGMPPTSLVQVHAVIAALQTDGACVTVVEMCRALGIIVGTATHRLQLAQLQDVHSSLTALARMAAARQSIERALLQPDTRYLINSAQRWDLIVRLVRNSSRVIVAGQSAQVLERLRHTLLSAGSSARPGPIVGRLLKTLRDRDTDGYAAAYEDLLHVYDGQVARQRCGLLGDRLAAVHPDLAERLRAGFSETAWDQQMPQLQAAWNWSRAAAHVAGMSGVHRERERRQALDEVEVRLRQVTEVLAGKQALLHFIMRKDVPMSKALQAFRTAVNLFGKDGGTYKSQRLKSLRSAMRDASRAIPALLMPVGEVASDVPAEPDTFDVVIVDEASQVTIDSTFLLWLAPRAIIVGDDQQCSPGVPPKKLPAYWRMANAYLREMPDHLRQGFGPDSNLYELMSTHLVRVVRLVEHFRCMPEIIGWSSDEFYQGRLLPLRQFGAERLDPLVVIPVENADVDGVGTSIRNHTEAAEIVERIKKLIEDPRYQDKSIGVIVMFGADRHTKLLDQLLDERIGHANRKRFNIRVGDPPAFQGDERDVILLSMVVKTRPSPATSRKDRQRFNVAASRARDQLWLFTSVPADELGTTDLRRSLLTYMQNPPAKFLMDRRLDQIPTDRLRTPFESLLEQRVFGELRRQDFTVIPQYPIYGRPIDLLVVGDNGQLAVECHSPALPMTPDDIARDIERERELRPTGWEIVRIRESDYLLDPEAALAPLWEQLRRRGIGPTSLRPAPLNSTQTWTPINLPDSEDDDHEDSDA
ncbi:AAA domain-containing protein [Paractinoplanes hotanensis]|uniref:AAA domain-containing protein n=1 Tax=Paractinoplanes hotanensis TaxID=2906497 RepID=A0ABT0Y8B2_9ACTN|nr:AAA domain-containing protein [Actinoplanes hotanensis]MCM4082274.1 AAA domain-containing protein [Actinoplanes hotanensis]